MKHGQQVRVARLTTERGTFFDSLADLYLDGTICKVDGINEIGDGLVFAFLRVPGWENRPEVPVELLERVK